MISHTIAVRTHGHYLLDGPSRSPAVGVLVGCHGYMESAAIQMERLQAIPGGEAWVHVSVQGLHRFYHGRSSDVVASWMTSQDRELAIHDNTDYLNAVVDAVLAETPAGSLVFAGFSQGVGMAFRAASASTHPVAAVLALGGDVPPELTHDRLARIPRVLYGRGDRDGWYTAEQFAEDQARLRHAGVTVTASTSDDEHEWTERFSTAAGRFLQELAPARG